MSKRPAPPLDRQEKCPRVTLVMLDMRIEHMGQMISALQQLLAFLNAITK
jgi:hypothetical protein